MADEFGSANFKPDTTDKQLSSIKVRTNRLVVADVNDSAPLSSVAVFCRSLRIKAETGNDGVIFIGAEISADLRNNGYPLNAGQELELPVNDLSIVFYQGNTVDDAIRIIYTS